MKKIFTLIMALTLMMSFIACGTNNNDPIPNNSVETTEIPTPETTEDPTESDNENATNPRDETTPSVDEDKLSEKEAELMSLANLFIKKLDVNIKDCEISVAAIPNRPNHDGMISIIKLPDYIWIDIGKDLSITILETQSIEAADKFVEVQKNQENVEPDWLMISWNKYVIIANVVDAENTTWAIEIVEEAFKNAVSEFTFVPSPTVKDVKDNINQSGKTKKGEKNN